MERSVRSKGNRGIRLAFLKALSEETRLRVLEELKAAGELSVGDVCERVGKEQSNISHHLACLRSCGLVSTRREGKNIYYSLNGKARISRILDLVDRHALDAAEGILACTEVSSSRVRR
jgi:ArsR family transcriptional regulator